MYATFVLPAPNGCNLKCSYCAVALRGEATQNKLTHDQYLAFLDATLAFASVNKVSIVGYEPILEESIELTIALLKRAQEENVETSVNTNGLNLPRYAASLAEVADTVMISLDSHLSNRNDKLRGKIGAFTAAVSGIRSALAHFGQDRVVVNTLLISHRLDFVAGMPELLSKLGIRSWVISPYIRFDQGRLLSCIQDTRAAIAGLAERALRFGVVLNFADEFGIIGRIDGVPTFNFQRPGGQNAFVYRLSPDGSCSIGVEILNDSSTAAIWDGEQPAVFLRSLCRRIVPRTSHFHLYEDTSELLTV